MGKLSILLLLSTTLLLTACGSQGTINVVVPNNAVTQEETVELYPNNIIEVKVFTITTVKAIK